MLGGLTGCCCDCMEEEDPVCGPGERLNLPGQGPGRLAQCVPAEQPDGGGAGAGAGVGGTPGAGAGVGGTPGACSTGSFFIERPPWRPGAIGLMASCPGVGRDDFAGCLAQVMTEVANERRQAWFGRDAAVEAQVVSTLEPRSAPPWRRDRDHLGFLRLTFQSTGVERLPLFPVDGWAECDVLATLRERVDALSLVPQLRVGRECAVLAAEAAWTVDEAPDGEMATWHLGRIGLDAESPGGGEGVDVALIDTGVHVRLAADGVTLPAECDVTKPGGCPLDDARPGFATRDPTPHRHGSAMALLIHALAPDARIRSYRVFDQQGVATTGDVAHAVDIALDRWDQSQRSDPLIINLSLGWPPELGLPRVIEAQRDGLQCRAVDDPVGGALRFVLDTARRRAREGGRPLLIVAAAGNRPLREDATDAIADDLLSFAGPSDVGGFTTDTCGRALNGPRTSGLFYPARWAMEGTCRSDLDGGDALETVLAVGGTDDRDAPTAVAIPGREPAILAPAQHVYVDHVPGTGDGIAGFDRPGEGAQCGGASPDYPPLKLPAAFTGTSVAAALVTGAAARTWAGLRGRVAPLPSAEVLARLIHLTGVSVCDAANRARPSDRTGLAARLLAVDRLDAVLEPRGDDDLGLQRLTACLEQTGSGAMLSSMAAQGCAGLLQELLASSNVRRPACQAGLEPVGWPASYVDDGFTACPGNEPARATAFEAEDADACDGLCPFEEEALRDLAGRGGPQPGEEGCPECTMLGRLANAKVIAVDLLLELYGGYLAGTSFQAPYLVVDCPAGTGTKTRFISLGEHTNVDAWKPGASVVIQGLDPTKVCGFNDLAQWKRVVPRLYVQISSPTSTTAVTGSMSPLRLTFK
ncbi:MAG: S8/S53 family peptidase [bacterium]